MYPMPVLPIKQSTKMKHLTVILFLLGIFSSCAFSQTLNADRVEKINAMLSSNSPDTAAIHSLLVEWQAEAPDDCELYPSWFNYYLLRSRESVIYLNGYAEGQGPADNDSFVIADENGTPVGELANHTTYSPEYFQKSIESIDAGIAMYPSRLDFYMGKATAQLWAGRYDDVVTTVLQTIDASLKNNNTWMWTNNEPLGEYGRERFNDITDIILQLVDAGETNKALYLFDVLIASYSDYPMFQVIKADLLAYIGQYQQALAIYEPLLSSMSDDLMMVCNMAYAYRQLNMTDKVLEMCTILEKSNNDEAIQRAKQLRNSLSE